MKFSFIYFVLITVSVYSQNGNIKSYYANGVLKSEISFTNDVLDGPYIIYYPNGNVMTEKNYSKGVLNGYVREFYEDGLIRSEIFVRNGLIDGNVKKYFRNGGLESITVYNNGLYEQSSSFGYDSLYIASPESYQLGNRQQAIIENKNQDLICDVEICPVPVGGFDILQNNLIYPEHALIYGLEGTVVLIASIDSRGNVTHTEVIKHLGLGCDEAAQDVVKKTQFIPGQSNNRAVNSRITLSIEFKIYDTNLVSEINNTKNFSIDVQTKNSTEVVQPSKSLYTQFLIECEIEECPFPVDGIKSIYEKLIVPGIAKRLKLKSEIVIEALIDKYGYVLNTSIIKGIGYGCDEAAESAIMKTKFKPGRKNGNEIDTKVKITFPFDYDN